MLQRVFVFLDHIKEKTCSESFRREICTFCLTTEQITARPQMCQGRHPWSGRWCNLVWCQTWKSAYKRFCWLLTHAVTLTELFSDCNRFDQTICSTVDPYLTAAIAHFWRWAHIEHVLFVLLSLPYPPPPSLPPHSDGNGLLHVKAIRMTVWWWGQ